MAATQYQFVLEDTNASEFQDWVPKLVSALQQLPELTDVASDLQQSGLGAEITIDRATAARYGITPASIDNALYDSFGQRITSTIFTQSNQYRVILEADPNLQPTLASINRIFLPSATGGSGSNLSGAGQVPLGDC